MKRFFLALMLAIAYASTTNAQSIRETFDSNSLGWNETAISNDAGSAIIDKGVLTLTSNGVNKFLSAMLGIKLAQTLTLHASATPPLTCRNRLR